MKSTISIVLALFLGGCYPDFVTTPGLQFNIGDAQIAQRLQKNLDECRSKLDAIRQNEYDSQKGRYNGTVLASSVTLLSGTGAGALGASSEKTWSGITGALSLVSGLVTIWVAGPSTKEAAALMDSKKANEQWGTVLSAKTDIENAYAEIEHGDAQEVSKQLVAALKKYNAACNNFRVTINLLDLYNLFNTKFQFDPK